ncbi:alpha-methylacyl-CoA racemase isoform X1 [Diabrotica virgifera virgifera]|uniref:Alpha-methylacyl-CoA racemase n=2 Tax=Diabrotica virgifera virgifera TaxID=50390 RepID=A0ABM5IU65_DIAVI|nr:alpha-methylacyl-CoA racemase isoform X1 [Diabrotica virgifera virgifera]
MALKGLKVIEFSGLLPVPYCGMVLAEFGASVIRIDKIGYNSNLDCLGNGKQSMSLNLKHSKAINIIKSLTRESDVLIEPFRKGIMEKLGLGPKVLMKENPRLIYARLTGYGQNGSFSSNAGHDINYVALSGLLSLFGRYEENPLPPVNVLADIGGGGLTCAMGILLALIERSTSGKGQIVDTSMVEGTAYLGTWFYRGKNTLPIWGQGRGQNVLDSGTHFYEVYKTKDDRYMSVGALEPQFYDKLIEGLGLTLEEVPHYGDFEELKKIFTKKFAKKTREEWCQIFDSTDACVAPVLTLDEAPTHPHNIEQKTFTKTEDFYSPNPHPKLSRTPGESHSTKPLPRTGEHTKEVLRNLGYSLESIDDLEAEGVIQCYKNSKL